MYQYIVSFRISGFKKVISTTLESQLNPRQIILKDIVESLEVRYGVKKTSFENVIYQERSGEKNA